MNYGSGYPFFIQIGKYVTELSEGDFGKSLGSHQPVAEELKAYLPATIELVVLSTIIAIFVGIPLGVLSARRKDQLVDHFSRIFSVGAVSLPTFWVGLFLQLLFYRHLGFLPLGDQLSTAITLLY